MVAQVKPQPEEEAQELLRVVIQSPSGSRHRYGYDEASGLFELKGALPSGCRFPMDFGWVPGTKAGDGEPLPILVLLDEPTFPGCLLSVRLLGVLQADQVRAGKTRKVHWLTGVAAEIGELEAVRSLSDLPRPLMAQLEEVFVCFHAGDAFGFRLVGVQGAGYAGQLVEEAAERFRRRQLMPGPLALGSAAPSGRGGLPAPVTSAPAEVEEELHHGEITVSRARCEARVGSERVELTSTELKLLTALIERGSNVQSRDTLLNEVWGYESSFLQTRTVDSHIRRLRGKLGKAGDNIQTIRGFGYRMVR